MGKGQPNDLLEKEINALKQCYFGAALSAIR